MTTPYSNWGPSIKNWLTFYLTVASGPSAFCSWTSLRPASWSSRSRGQDFVSRQELGSGFSGRSPSNTSETFPSSSRLFLHRPRLSQAVGIYALTGICRHSPKAFPWRFRLLCSELCTRGPEAACGVEGWTHGTRWYCKAHGSSRSQKPPLLSPEN